MDKRYLQYEILEKKYNPSAWKEVMIQVFGAIRLYQQAVSIPLPANEIVEKAVELGSFYTQDERLVGIYELTLKPDSRTKIAYNKIGLRNLLRNVYKYDVDGALIVFIQGERWRFSYVSEIRMEDGKKETEPKRFTYLFGNGEVCRTAAERFYSLIGKPIKLADLFEAFNVDKLNKDFFKGYKEFYQRAVRHLVETKSYYKLLIDNNEKEEQSKQKPIRDFVKKLLGRIVFLHFLQKKGWMGVPATNKNWKGGDKHFMQKLFAENDNKPKFYSECLKILFFKTLNTKRNSDLFLLSLTSKREPVKIPFLNGGLFDNDISFENDIDFPAEYFAQLFDFFEQYNFTIDENDPYESEVGIDPEMLGHIFENLLEENKEKGAFYTPKEVVHFMCQECLIEYLKSNIDLPEEAISSYIRNNEVDKKLTQHETARHIEVLLKAVKVCDPAIGSGAFPMGMLKGIFECRRLIYPYLKITDAFDPAQVKKEIIKNNIYGVDIEPGAVDIARLRFWLALVVDEDSPEPLPNLDYKIMQGNSLLERFDGIDLSKIAEADDNLVVSEKNQIILPGMGGNMQTILVFDNVTKQTLYTLIEKFFDPEEWEKTHKEKVDKEKIKRQINDIVEGAIHAEVVEEKRTLENRIKSLEVSWRKASVSFQEMNVKSKQVKQYNQLKERLEHLDAVEEKLVELQKTNHKPFFLWHLFFKDVFDNGGFDIVIGNPPYIQLQKDSGSLAKLFEPLGFDTFERTGDIYSIFYEQGMRLLNSTGLLCYITSNKWMRTNYGASIRNFFAEKTYPLLLIDFGNVQVFETATVDTNIILLKNKPKAAKYETNEMVAVRLAKDFSIKEQSLAEYVAENSYKMGRLTHNSWIIGEKDVYDVKGFVEYQGIPLNDSKWKIKINYGIKTGLNEAFIVNGEVRKDLIEKDPKSQDLLKPILRGKDIISWYPDFDDYWLIISHNGYQKNGQIVAPVKVENYPAIREWLELNEPKLSKRVDKGVTSYNLRDCAYWSDFKKPKIIYPNMTKYLPFVYDEDDHFYSNDKSFILVGEHLKYLTCFFNSKLFKYCFLDNFPELQGGTRELRKVFFDKIPVKQITDEEEVAFCRIVDYLVALKREKSTDGNDKAMFAYFEQIADALVYEFYFKEEFQANQLSVSRYIKHIPVLNKNEPILRQLRTIYVSLNSQEHPIRQAVFTMISIPQIALVNNTVL